MFRKFYAFDKTIFSVGFLVGVILACLLIKRENERLIENSCQIKDKSLVSYEEWFSRSNLKRYPVAFDILSYGQKESVPLESSYLYDYIHLRCVIFVKKTKNAHAIANTWGKHCNHIVFISTENITDISVVQLKPKSSWHYLCEAIRFVWETFENDIQWTLFAPDDLYVIPENLRHYVAYLNYNSSYYLGDDITFWGQLYNVGEAGYVLSRGTIKKLYTRFSSYESCLKSGKYWKNDDFYLGKYLSELGIFPTDTKDDKGCARFHRYNLNYVRGLQTFKTSAKLKQFSVGCYSDHTITFNGIESDKFYLYYYLLYQVKVFSHGGSLGNHPPPSSLPDSEVWKKFVREEGVETPDHVSAKQYYELWERKIPSPDILNAFLRRQAQDAFSSEAMSGPAGQ